MTDTIVKQHRYYWDDADHLIKLAREYDAQARGSDAEEDDEYYLYWKYRLARMSFIARMMAIEALLNNLLEQFSIPEKFKQLDELAEQFSRSEKFPKNRRKRKGRTFQIPLKWKLYLTPYLCNDDSQMDRDEYFKFDESTFRKFSQLIMIRNEFVHTRLVDRDFDIHIAPKSLVSKSSPLEKMLQDQDYADCCQEMGIDQDPVCFHVDNARVCGVAMRDVVIELNQFLKGRILTREFWESDQIDQI